MATPIQKRALPSKEQDAAKKRPKMVTTNPYQERREIPTHRRPPTNDSGIVTPLAPAKQSSIGNTSPANATAQVSSLQLSSPSATSAPPIITAENQTPKGSSDSSIIETLRTIIDHRATAKYDWLTTLRTLEGRKRTAEQTFRNVKGFDASLEQQAKVQIMQIEHEIESIRDKALSIPDDCHHAEMSFITLIQAQVLKESLDQKAVETIVASHLSGFKSELNTAFECNEKATKASKKHDEELQKHHEELSTLFKRTVDCRSGLNDQIDYSKSISDRLQELESLLEKDRKRIIELEQQERQRDERERKRDAEMRELRSLVLQNRHKNEETIPAIEDSGTKAKHVDDRQRQKQSHDVQKNAIHHELFDSLIQRIELQDANMKDINEKLMLMSHRVGHLERQKSSDVATATLRNKDEQAVAATVKPKSQNSAEELPLRTLAEIKSHVTPLINTIIQDAINTFDGNLHNRLKKPVVEHASKLIVAAMQHQAATLYPEIDTMIVNATNPIKKEFAQQLESVRLQQRNIDLDKHTEFVSPSDLEVYTTETKMFVRDQYEKLAKFCQVSLQEVREQMTAQVPAAQQPEEDTNGSIQRLGEGLAALKETIGSLRLEEDHLALKSLAEELEALRNGLMDLQLRMNNTTSAQVVDAIANSLSSRYPPVDASILRNHVMSLNKRFDATIQDLVAAKEENVKGLQTRLDRHDADLTALMAQNGRETERTMVDSSSRTATVERKESKKHRDEDPSGDSTQMAQASGAKWHELIRPSQELVIKCAQSLVGGNATSANAFSHLIFALSDLFKNHQRHALSPDCPMSPQSTTHSASMDVSRGSSATDSRIAMDIDTSKGHPTHASLKGERDPRLIARAKSSRGRLRGARSSASTSRAQSLGSGNDGDAVVIAD